MSISATAKIEGGCYECGSTFGLITQDGGGPVCIKCNPDVASDSIETFAAIAGELSQDIINWRVAMGSWVWEAIKECEKALADEGTDKRVLRWYRDALAAAKAIAAKYNIRQPAPPEEE